MAASSRQFRVAVVGATGVVGAEMLRVLKQREFPVGEVRALASERSAGQTVAFNGSRLEVAALDEHSFEGIDIALFSAGAGIARDYAPIAVEAGALVIDNSSAWRMAENCPLVVPEVNGDDISAGEGIIANPNCCAIPLAMVVEAIRQAVGIERVVVATYQSASGAGKPLVDELEEQTRVIASGGHPVASVYPKQLAHNVVPGGWSLEADAYNEEEVKIVNETRKILHDPSLRVAVTCVRVPVPVGHGEAVFLETAGEISAEQARSVLDAFPGITVEDDLAGAVYPTPAEVAGKDDVYVGRIRRDQSTRHGLALWVVSDNLRKGAALNAVQVAERAIEMGVLRST
ncbi:MAG TPA: aspartate-semialdehyde dehydrogenase [Candidatus Dormibacteraeota bacterium]|nr:aspartate-semialdehyde dehydrogenase [Candidatus Dormibacteraeota bacterium]